MHKCPLLDAYSALLIHSFHMTYLFLDTNIFLQFQDFENIKWQDICHCQNITIVVTGIAIREIDKKKDSSRSKLRDRAKKIGKKINKILRGEQSCKYALIHVGFPNKNTMENPVFNKEINDDWLVHTANDFILPSEYDEKIIISNDFNVYSRALPFNIKVIEVPDMYLLPQELTDEEKKIKELENKLFALEKSFPNVNLTFPKGKDSIHIDLVERPDITSRNGEIRTELETETPYKVFEPNDNIARLFAAIRDFSLTEEDFNYYNSLLPEYYESESKYRFYKEICSFINDNMLPLEFELHNTGNSPSGFLGLYLSFSDNATIFTDDSRTSLEFKRVEKPQLISSWQRKLAIPNFFMPAHQQNTLYTWDIESPQSVSELNQFTEYNPIVHHHPPVSIFENKFYIFKCIPQKIEIHWKLIDSFLTHPKEGILRVEVG